MPERPALCVPQRHTDITLGAYLLQPEVLREFFLQAGRRHANMTRRDPLTGSAGKSIRESRSKIRAFPKSQRSRFYFAERFCDKRILRAQRLCRASGQ